MTLTTARLRGAFTALITPFKDGAVDHEALAALVERQIVGGIDGLVPCGTTGEAATMSDEERLATIRTVVEVAAGRVPIIAGTGSNDTAQTIAFTKRAAAIPGVDGALVVCPYYNKPNQHMMLRHFTAVADEGGLPVVLYNVPGRTAVSLTPETVAALARHPNILAIKEATADMIFDTKIVELTRGLDFVLLSGDDFTTMPLIACGGKGCISVVSNLDPGTMSRLCHATLEHKMDEALLLHLKVQPLARVLFAQPNPVPVKEAAAMLGWCSPELRAPLYGSEPGFDQTLRAALTAYGLL
jgi:4-hydroxy-tetrahydrodipicolinate synthase